MSCSPSKGMMQPHVPPIVSAEWSEAVQIILSRLRRGPTDIDTARLASPRPAWITHSALANPRPAATTTIHHMYPLRRPLRPGQGTRRRRALSVTMPRRPT